MQKGLINPKDFIKNTESHQDYICNICYQICVRPARCQGSCQKIFCLKCVSQSRMSQDRCPMRCSSPFNVQILPQLEIQFQCPYNAVECKSSILSLQQFNDHYKNCSYVPQQELYFKKMKNEFRCLKDHQLQFFIGSFEEMCNSDCNLCQEKKLCRAICRQCDNALFCVQCRTPPCQKGKCPIGHQMKLWVSQNLAYICDLCGISTAISKSNVYDDTQCNFGMCGDCFQNIGKKDGPKIKLQSNKDDQCQKTHKLTISKDQDIFAKCSKCKKLKQCVKECKECQTKYCLSCKIAEIQGDQTCFQNHNFHRICTETFSPEKLENYKCMKCDKESNLIFYDSVCRIRLCTDCFMYGLILASQKERFIENIYCKKNHILRYMNNPEHHEGFCTQCKRKMPAKLFCDFCDIREQCYCCTCKPLSKFQTCYFGHKLIEVEKSQNQPCQPCCLCGLEQKEMVGCRKCSFFICKKCQDQYDESKSFYEGQNWMHDQSLENCN